MSGKESDIHSSSMSSHMTSPTSTGCSAGSRDTSNKQVPKALVLTEPTTLTRDSGCYTGSPLSLAGSAGACSSTSIRPPVFTFGPSPSSISTPCRPGLDISEVKRRPSLPSAEHLAFVTPADSLLSKDEESEAEDEVFQMSSDFSSSSRHDSGYGQQSLTVDTRHVPPDSRSFQSESYSAGHSVFYLRSDDYDNRSTSTVCSSTDEDSLTPPHCELPKGSPVSQPIAIPRSPNNSPRRDENDVDETDGIMFSLPAAEVGEQESDQLGEAADFWIGSPFPGGSPRVTFSQPNPRAIDRDRPSSGHARMQGHTHVERSYSQSVEGARGPLPDLIQPSMRSRAYSESAIYTAQMVEHVGNSLRNMCDQFTEVHIARQRNLTLLRSIQTGTPPENLCLPQIRGHHQTSTPHMSGTDRSAAIFQKLHNKFFSSKKH